MNEATSVIGMDTGPWKSAWVHYAGARKVLGLGYSDNLAVRDELDSRADKGTAIAIEMYSNYQKPVGKKVFRGCLWNGLFLSLWLNHPERREMIDPWKDFERHLPVLNTLVCYHCGARSFTSPGGDIKGYSQANIKSSVLETYFGDAETAIGGKSCKVCKGSRHVGRERCPICLESKKAKRKTKCNVCDSGKDKRRFEKADCPACDATGWGIPPGPLHGVKNFPNETIHIFQALAVATWYWDRFVEGGG